MANENDGSGAGLSLFLGWAGSRGEMNPSTAKSYQAAVKGVLSVEAEPADVDIRNVDVDAILDRFETLHRTRYTADSMATYKSRFRQAVAMYLAWLDKDSAWRAAGRSRRVGTQAGVSPRPKRRSTAATDPPADDSSPPAGTGAHRMIAYDLPLRPDMIVRLTLPVDMTPADADRVANFARSLAFARPAEPPSASFAAEAPKPQG
jgi:hypothetical protein